MFFLRWFVADGFDIVPVRIQDERAVVVRVVDGPEPRLAVIPGTRVERHGVELVHLRTIFGSENNVRRVLWETTADRTGGLAKGPGRH